MTTADPAELAEAYYEASRPPDEPYAQGELLPGAPYIPIGYSQPRGSALLLVLDGTCRLVRDVPPDPVRLLRVLDLFDWLAADGHRLGQLEDLLSGKLIEFEWLPAIPGLSVRNEMLFDLVVDFTDIATLRWYDYRLLTERGPRLFLKDRPIARVLQRYATSDARIPRALDPEGYRFENKAETGSLMASDFAGVPRGQDETEMQPTVPVGVKWTTKVEMVRKFRLVQAVETGSGRFSSIGFDRANASANLIRNIRRAIGRRGRVSGKAQQEADGLVAAYGFQAPA